MADNPELNLEGIPEAQREAVTKIVTEAIAAAVTPVAAKAENDLGALRKSLDGKYETLLEESRGHQRTIAEMKDEGAGSRATELGKSVNDLEAGWKAETDAKTLADSKAETAALRARLDASDLETAKSAALAAGVPEALVNQAKSSSELEMATTIHSTYGDKTPTDGKPAGMKSPVSTMTPAADGKSAIDTSTHQGQITHSLSELAEAGMPMDK